MKTKPGLDEIRIRSDELDKCVNCGLCQSVCPTYLTSGNEGLTARGKIEILKSILNGSLEPSGSIARLFDDCLTCYACQSVCPAGVKTERLWTPARQELTPLYGYGILKRLGLKWTIGSPALFNLLVKVTGILTGYNRGDEDGAKLSGKSFPIFSGAPYLSKLEREYPATGKEIGSIGLLLGCTCNLSTPWIADAVIKVLTNAGYRVIIPVEQVCCGAPAINNGSWEVAKKLAERNLEVFNSLGVDYITSPDGTCAGTFRHDYRLLFEREGNNQSEIEELSKKTIDLSVLLYNALSAGSLRIEGSVKSKVTLHDSCHVTHSGTGNRWRELLSVVEGLDLIEMKRSEHCCGFGGSYAYSHPRESLRIAERKLRDAFQTGASQVLVGSPGCLLRLKSLLSDEQTGELRVRHAVEVIEKAIT